MLKFERLAIIIREQIEKGDFFLSDLPSERILAEKLDANRITIHKALTLLEQENIVKRADNSRYEITTIGASKNIKTALLAPPAFSSGNIRIWHEELMKCAEKNNFLYRPVLFVHWNDSVFSDIIPNFDGIFIIPSGEKIPKETLRQFHLKKGLVLLNTDMSHQNILSINLFPSTATRQLLDQLNKAVTSLGTGIQ